MSFDRLSLQELGWASLTTDVRAWALAISMSLIMAIGGVALKLGFNSMGGFTVNLRSLFSWAFNPWIVFALGCGIGARFLYFLALNYMSLGEITLLSAMSMVMTVVLAYFVFGETLEGREIVGAILVLVGVVLIEG
jgi:drug/metabolite transporter (DMT)-like permease